MKLTLTTILLFFIYNSTAQFGNTEILSIESRRDLHTATFADLDQDGDDDILASEEHRVLFFENNGTGIFATEILLFEHEEILNCLSVKDVDEDGSLDIVLFWSDGSSNAGSIEFWSQTSPMNFDLVNTLSIGANTNSDGKAIEFRDMDNDGLDDLVLSSHNIYHFKHTSGFDFIYVDTYPMTSGIVSIEDVNNDGWLDIVGQTWDSFYVGLNDSTGHFSTFPTYPGGYTGALLSETKLLDYDLDGDLDAIHLHDENGAFGSDKITLFSNDGFGVFTEVGSIETTNYTQDMYNLTLRDVNSDGVMDIVWKETPLLSSDQGATKCKLGNGTSFGVEFEINGSFLSSIPLDFSDNIGNGTDNILFYGGTNFLLHRLVVVNRTNPGEYFGEEYYREKFYNGLKSLYSVDINNDGYSDFISPPLAYISQANGSFDVIVDSSLILPTTNPNYSFKFYGLTDVNNDGYQDLLGISEQSNVTIGYWLGSASGNFGNFSAIANSNVIPDVIGGHDINYDGYMDIYFTTHPLSDYPKVYYSIGSGTGFVNTYEAQSAWASSNLSEYYPYQSLKFAENSLAPDDLEYVYIINGLISVATNGTPTRQELNITASSIFIDDIDNNGLQDIYYTIPTGIAWIKNEGNNLFTDQGLIQSVTNNAANPFPLFTDVDNDSDIDIVYTNDTLVYLIESLGFGSFSPPVEIASGVKPLVPSNGAHRNIHIMDVENDGDKDLFYLRPSEIWFDAESDVDLVYVSNYSVGPNSISGYVFNDLNSNQIFDSSDTYVQWLPVDLNFGGATDYTDINGQYLFSPVNGNHTVSFNPPLNWSLTTDSIQYSLQINNQSTTYDSLYFGISPDTLFIASEPQLIGSFPRCNTIGNMWMVVNNTGTLGNSGVIELSLDDSLTFVGSQYPPDSIVGTSYYWHYDSLEVFSSMSSYLNVLFPDFQSASDTVTSILTTWLEDSVGNYYNAGIDTLKQRIVCAYDPNDKTVEPSGVTELGFIDNDQTLEYLIRFQNTGNDTAINVKILDQLHPNLDVSSLQILGSSFPVTYSLESSNNVVFDFDNIMLPDSNTNFLGSQGFVKFKIDMVPNLGHYEQIINQAQIYFDLNPAVITNNTTNTIFDCDSVLQLQNLYSGPLCEGEIASMVNNSAWVEENEWFVNGVIASNDSIFNVPATYPEDTITLVAKHPFCNVDTSLVISAIEFEFPDLQLGTSLLLCDGDSVVLSTPSTFNNTWFFNGVNVGTGNEYTAWTEGMYVIHHENGSCSAEDSVYLFYYTVAPPSISGGDTIISCENDSVQLYSTYSADNIWYFNGSQISVDNNVFVQQTGLYIVEHANPSCQQPGVDSVWVNFNPLPVAGYTYINSSTVQSVGNFNVYSWLNCDNNFEIVFGENDSIFTPSSPGYYALSVVDEFGCSDTTECFYVQTTGLNHIDNSIRIYPNPTSTIIFIEGITDNAEISLFDASGREVIRDKNIKSLDVSELAGGTYMVQIKGDSRLLVQRLIILKDL